MGRAEKSPKSPPSVLSSRLHCHPKEHQADEYVIIVDGQRSDKQFCCFTAKYF